MRTGTPGFVGDRLREAREVRVITAASLAELIDVTPQSISLYENDRSSPSSDVLQKLATTLNLPPHFFLLPPREYAGGTIFYRSMASTTKGARSRALRRYAWLRDIVTYLSQYVELPISNFPDLRLPDDPLLLSDDDIENAADSVRTHWRLREGPIANMVLLLENHGAVLARDRLGAESMDGLSEFAAPDHRPYVIIGTDRGTPCRWRFDAAHELGHLVLHAGVSPEFLRRSESFKQIEQQAHRFAAAFLLPLASFGDDLFGVNLDALLSLKTKWNVSVAMMILRARHAGFLNEEAEKKLWINYSRRGWRRNEPYDDPSVFEEPRLLRRSFELLLEQGIQTTEDVLANLALPVSDVESLSALPSGFLSGYSPVRLLRPLQDDDKKITSQGEIVQMPFRRR